MTGSPRPKLDGRFPGAEPSPLLKVENLCVEFGVSREGCQRVIDGASFALEPGRILALVGESGSGKTMVARSILKLLPPGATICDGRILFGDEDLAQASEDTMRRVRGGRVGMIFQEPMMSLNPARKIGFQMAEAMLLHTSLSPSEIRSESIEMLRRVRIADPAACLDRYPHEFSGGMRQRIMLASVMLPNPSLLLADEPTTALDNIVQKDVLDIIVALTREQGTSVILITHDLSLVAQYADEIVLMKQGHIIEAGPTQQILHRPKHTYTKALLDVLPRSVGAVPVQTGAGTPLVTVESLSVEYGARSRWFRRRMQATRAVDDLSLTLHRGETLAIVGESGSGKTTTGRAILRLVPKSAGTIAYNGVDVHSLDSSALRALRSKMQLVFQDPWSSLDPRMRVRAIIGEGLRNIPGLLPADIAAKVTQILQEVDLLPLHGDRFPHELSGGQRQRVCIARALVLEPEFLVADEPVAALDATVQAQVLELLLRLKCRYGFACLFISHDLAIVEGMADRVAVMYRGKIVEIGSTKRLFGAPHHPYTRKLLSVRPRLIADREGYHLSPRDLQPAAAPTGFRFAEPEGGWAPSARLVSLHEDHSVLCVESHSFSRSARESHAE